MKSGLEQAGSPAKRVLVTGGARSGKSSFAERYAASLSSDGTGIYIATLQPYDEEMRERTRLHQLRREQAAMAWRTIEEPLQAAALLDRLAASRAPAVLLDCLTLWLTNWLLQVEHSPDRETVLQAEIDRLASAAAAYPGPIVLVTNEVGDGLVPEYPLGRLFRDWAGWLNQRVAGQCDEVFLVTAGIPVELKKLAFTFEQR
ncbi:bifunctional adenosylcobinamide kinase/adenosylcobinamide-phosphate guanylyltransferase [Paenibacillus sp. y28]|uniref:bifunctional adenosylcobinamide kinase/adenosylcobinamide-phosphate guanylyltransferase n=1 Tax=Paenibacillus sp. y28 TaxID=3129110 RepID=UPI0030182463